MQWHLLLSLGESRATVPRILPSPVTFSSRFIPRNRTPADIPAVIAILNPIPVLILQVFSIGPVFLLPQLASCLLAHSILFQGGRSRTRSLSISLGTGPVTTHQRWKECCDGRLFDDLCTFDCSCWCRV